MAVSAVNDYTHGFDAVCLDVVLTHIRFLEYNNIKDKPIPNSYPQLPRKNTTNLDGTTNASQLKDALNNLQSNIITLKQGGMISGVDLEPLPSGFYNLWNIVNRNCNLYKTSVAQILTSYQQAKASRQSFQILSLIHMLLPSLLLTL